MSLPIWFFIPGFGVGVALQNVIIACQAEVRDPYSKSARTNGILVGRSGRVHPTSHFHCNIFPVDGRSAWNRVSFVTLPRITASNTYLIVSPVQSSPTSSEITLLSMLLDSTLKLPRLYARRLRFSQGYLQMLLNKWFWRMWNHWVCVSTTGMQSLTWVLDYVFIISVPTSVLACLAGL